MTDEPEKANMVQFSSKLISLDASELLTSKDASYFIGSGGFACVRLCHHSKFGNVVAKCFAISGSRTHIESQVNSIKREAEVLVRLTHPNIVKVHGVANWNNNVVAIILEYVECGSLTSLLESNENISWPLRLQLCQQLSSAISYLHSPPIGGGFYHGDIKSENILLDKHLNVKLVDFGSVNLVKHVNTSSTTLDIAPSTQYTQYYAAPEVLNKQKSGPPSDIYSYGMVLYEMICRILVYQGAQINPSTVVALILRGLRPDLDKVKAVKASLTNDRDQDIASLLIELMKECWNTDPTKRPTAEIVEKRLISLKDEDTQLQSETKTLGEKLRRLRETAVELTRLSCFLPPFIKVLDPPPVKMQGLNDIGLLKEPQSLVHASSQTLDDLLLISRSSQTASPHHDIATRSTTLPQASCSQHHARPTRIPLRKIG